MSIDSSKGRRTVVVVLFLLACLVGTRLALLGSNLGTLINIEEMYNARLALALASGEQVQWPPYGYQYMAHTGGMLVVSLALVPWAQVFGLGLYSIKLLSVAFCALAFLSLGAALHRTEGLLAAALFGLLLAFASPLYAVFNVMLYGNHSESVAILGLSTLLFVIVLDVRTRPGRRTRAAVALGCANGFGVYFISSFVLVPLIQAVILLGRRQARGVRAWSLLGTVVGLLPLMAATAHFGTATLDQFTRPFIGAPDAEVSVEVWAGVAHALASVPATVLDDDWSDESTLRAGGGRTLAQAAHWILLGALFLGLGFSLVRREEASSSLLLFGSVYGLSMVVLWGLHPEKPTPPRYAVPVYPVACLVLAAVVSRVVRTAGKKRGLPVLLAGCLVGVPVVSGAIEQARYVSWSALLEAAPRDLGRWSRFMQQGQQWSLGWFQPWHADRIEVFLDAFAPDPGRDFGFARAFDQPTDSLLSSRSTGYEPEQVMRLGDVIEPESEDRFDPGAVVEGLGAGLVARCGSAEGARGRFIGDAELQFRFQQGVVAMGEALEQSQQVKPR